MGTPSLGLGVNSGWAGGKSMNRQWELGRVGSNCGVPSWIVSLGPEEETGRTANRLGAFRSSISTRALFFKVPGPFEFQATESLKVPLVLGICSFQGVTSPTGSSLFRLFSGPGPLSTACVCHEEMHAAEFMDFVEALNETTV